MSPHFTTALAWILDSTPWIPDSRYWILVFVSGTWILDSNPGFLDLYSRFHKQKFPGFQNLHSLIWGEWIWIVNNTACQRPFDCGFPAAGTESLLLLAEVREEIHLKAVVLKFRLTVEPVASLSAVFLDVTQRVAWHPKNVQRTAVRETIEPAA